MTAPNALLIPSLAVASQASGLTAGLQPLVTSTLSTPFETFEPSRSTSARYILAGSLATVALGTVLAGCRADPAPAPIAHESALPPNQGHCAPGSRDPFCQGYKASVQEMRHEREEGHHTDQALFLLLGIGIFLLVALPSTIMVVKRGRKIKKLEAELKEARPPESGDKPRKTSFFRRLFGRTPKTEAPAQTPKDPGNPPTNALQDKETKVGS